MSSEYSQIDFNNFMDINLEEYKKYLMDKKYEYQIKLNELEVILKNTNNLIIKKCKINNKGHEWITERESGMYGEKFTFCNKCGVDYYDTNY